MSPRTLLLLLSTVFAFETTAAVRLVAGDEIPISTLTRTLPEQVYDKSAMATDGDTILAVHAKGNAVFATRFDRGGELLTPEPQPIVQRTETDGISHTPMLRLLWFRNYYVMFVRWFDGSLRAVRITATGIPVETVIIQPSAGGTFDVATDGYEIVVVGTDPSLLRLDPFLKPIGTLPLSPLRFTGIAGIRSVAFGDGRFVIVTFDYGRVTAEILQNGTLTPAVEIGPAIRDSGSASRVVWTGSTFVAAWSECRRDNYNDFCLGVWTPLTSIGTAAGPLRVTSYAQFYSAGADDFEFHIAVVDRETVLFTWRPGDENVAMGRTYRLSGATVGPVSTFGLGPVSALVTNRGALAVLDARQRLAWIEAPATGLPQTPSFLATVRTPSNESVADVAVSATEVGVLHSAVREDGTTAYAVSILAHDGTLLREIALPGNGYGNGSITTDGHDFFVFTSQWFLGARFHNLATGKTITLSPYVGYPAMVWTGTELVTVSLYGEKLTITRLDRDGRLLALPTTEMAADSLLDLIARDGRVLLAYHDDRTTYVQELDWHGQGIGPPQEILDTNPWSQGAIATNGETDVLATYKADLTEMRVSFRPRNGTFVTPAGGVTKTRSGDNYASLAASAHGFVLAYHVRGPMLHTTHLALLDDQGYATRTLNLGAGRWGRQFLVQVAPNELLHISSRYVDDSRHAGATRAFMRRIAITNEDGARSEPEGRRSAPK